SRLAARGACCSRRTNGKRLPRGPRSLRCRWPRMEPPCSSTECASPIDGKDPVGDALQGVPRRATLKGRPYRSRESPALNHRFVTNWPKWNTPEPFLLRPVPCCSKLTLHRCVVVRSSGRGLCGLQFAWPG